MKRDNLLTKAWTGEPLMLNGRELVLSMGRQELLRSWKNEFFSDGSNQSAAHAIGEITLVCYSTRDEIMALNAMSDDDRLKAVIGFLLDNEDDMERLKIGIQERIDAIKAASVESETPGKEDVRHAP